MKKIYLTIILIGLLVVPAMADNITIINPSTTISPAQTGYIPTPTPIPTVTPTPSVAHNPYIYQGEKVYINDTIDISGVVPPYPELAYWNGYDMYDSNASYIINLPQYRSNYYNFYLDPSIFSTRMGKWYKYDGNYESNANDLAFIVHPQSMQNSTMRYSNGTLVNISEQMNNSYDNWETYIQPPVSIRHVSDYLVARGNNLSVKINTTTNIWLFGRIDELLDYKSSNTTYIDITKDILSGFEPGSYTVEMQTVGNTSNSFTVKYDASTDTIKWFDPSSFTIQGININGLSPQVLEQKFSDILPSTIDMFKTYNLELQDPSIEIQSINEEITPNETVNYAGDTQYNTNISYIEVKGYTNVAIGSTLKFILDEDRQTPKTLTSHTTTAVAGGSDDPGDMRWFDVVVPIDKYNMAAGDHTVTAYTNFSNSGSVYTFTIYMTPPNSYVPPQTIRYIAGRNGPEEFVPTPTPVVQTVTVPVPGPTQIVTVVVTPSNEQVKAQQEIIMNDSLKTWGTRIAIVIVIIGFIWYIISLILRRRELR